MSDPRIEEHKKKVCDKHKELAREVTLWVRGLMNANYWRNRVYYGDGMDATKAAMMQTMDELKNQQAVNRYAFGELGYIDADGPWNSGGGCWITRIHFATFALSIGIEDVILVFRQRADPNWQREGLPGHPSASEWKEHTRKIHGERCSTEEGWKQFVEDVCSGEIDPEDLVVSEHYEWGGMK